jgi:hypothetical protein
VLGKGRRFAAFVIVNASEGVRRALALRASPEQMRALRESEPLAHFGVGAAGLEPATPCL